MSNFKKLNSPIDVSTWTRIKKKIPTFYLYENAERVDTPWKIAIVETSWSTDLYLGWLSRLIKRNLCSGWGKKELFRVWSVSEFKLIFLNFKQYYTFFHTFFYTHIFQKTINNNSQIIIPNTPLAFIEKIYSLILEK